MIRAMAYMFPLFTFLFSTGVYAQNKILVKAEPPVVTIRKGIENNDFIIHLTIINNSQDSIRIPSSNAQMCHVLVKIPPHRPWYFEDKMFFDFLIPPVEQVIAPNQTGIVKLTVIGSCFKKRGKNKVGLYPLVYTLNNKKRVETKSAKIVVNVE
jgi:hypothetical protein